MNEKERQIRSVKQVRYMANLFLDATMKKKMLMQKTKLGETNMYAVGRKQKS